MPKTTDDIIKIIKIYISILAQKGSFLYGVLTEPQTIEYQF